MSFWQPRPVEKDDNRFSFTITTQTAIGPSDRQFLFGGVAMGLAIEAAEKVSEKPLLWATMQFLAPGMLGEDVEISVATLGGGRSISQLNTITRSGSRELQRMSAALGGREGVPDRVYLEMPDVPAPLFCDLKTDLEFGGIDTVATKFERRLAYEDSKHGVGCSWIRPKFDTPMSSSLLGIISDFFVASHRDSIYGTSLDNTLRVHSLEPTEWILSVTQMSSISRGAILGNQHHFAQNGTLLASSSQTAMVPNTNRS